MDKLKELHFWALMIFGPILIIWDLITMFTNMITSLIISIILLVIMILSYKLGKDYEHSADAVPKFSRYFAFASIFLVVIDIFILV